MEILKPGNILRILDFDFGNGADLRDKYLIVIEISLTQSLFLQVLTTSQLKVPAEKMMHGCRNESENGLHYFMFEQERYVGKLDDVAFAFPKHTFVLFRNNIKDIANLPFINKYGETATCVCNLLPEEFLRLKKCIRQNARMADRSAKRNFPAIFGTA